MFLEKELEFGAEAEAEVRHPGSDTELEQHSGGTRWLAPAVNPTLLFLKAHFAPWAKSGVTSHPAAGLLHYSSFITPFLGDFYFFFLLCYKSKFLLFRFSQDSPYREAEERDSALS